MMAVVPPLTRRSFIAEQVLAAIPPPCRPRLGKAFIMAHMRMGILDLMS
jgi:hypothetical protein